MMKHSYVGGFFDGRGSISISKAREYGGKIIYGLSVTIVSTEKEIIQDLLGKYKIGKITIRRPDSSHYKTTYVWIISGKQACIFLRKIEGYVRIKREKLLTGCTFQEMTKGKEGKKLRQNKVKLEELFYKTMKRLNTRCIPS